MDKTLIQAVRDLIDKQEIRDLLMRYARGVDRHDRALIEGAFHGSPSGEESGTHSEGTELADRLLSRDEGPCTTHLIGNQLIELDGDTARCESYFVSIVEQERAGKPYTRWRGGRYLDRLERRADAWGIVHRVIVDDWSRIDEIVTRVDIPGAHRGAFAPTDLVYRLRDDG